MNIQITDADIKASIKLKDDSGGQLKAVVTLTIGPFKVKGIRILVSDFENVSGERLWVAPPAYKDIKGIFHAQFWCEDKCLWKEIEGVILNKYRERRAKYGHNEPAESGKNNNL